MTTEDEPDREMRVAPGSRRPQLLAEYRASCDQHRELVASLPITMPLSRGQLSWRAESAVTTCGGSCSTCCQTDSTVRHRTAGHRSSCREMTDGRDASAARADRAARCAPAGPGSPAG